MKHKKYMDIQRIKPGFVDNFRPGDCIVIQEKVDGANAAIRWDAETNSIAVQSRKYMLSEENNLRGLYGFAQTLDAELVHSVLGEALVLFGEWLVPHSVHYPEDKYNTFYCYDVFDTTEGKYLPQDKVMEIAEKLGLKFVPIFYTGEFTTWEFCLEFVGRTELGGEFGEGIVVKNQTRLNDPDNHHPFYLKIVNEKMNETKLHKGHVKKVDAEKLKTMEESRALAESIVTKARVEKILHKFVDEGILPENWGKQEMPIIMKNLTKAVYEDCLKEEPEIVDQIENFGKFANQIAIGIVKSKL